MSRTPRERKGREVGPRFRGGCFGTSTRCLQLTKPCSSAGPFFFLSDAILPYLIFSPPPLPPSPSPQFFIPSSSDWQSHFFRLRYKPETSRESPCFPSGEQGKGVGTRGMRIMECVCVCVSVSGAVARIDALSVERSWRRP
jgi:hypothetical protein